MDNILEKPRNFIPILLALGAYLFFFQLDGMALTDPDETFYAQSAKEMLARNEWITPYLYGEPQFEKPILIYWLIELSYKVFGVNEFAARLPSAIFALIGVFAIYILGGLLFNRRVGALSAVMLASSVEYVILSRACVTDMVLSTF
ncbi:MAG: glycosyltransferase family 39 protein, partial [Candidatus Omnitrophica bacterium]|nr:glycosyltransferase family 39 protein [Candidatus Omnitrophota bacterium]